MKFLKQIEADIVKGIYTHTIQAQEDDVGEAGTQDTSQRGSYIIDDSEGTPLPLNYIVSLHETFADQESVNFVFEYLPGQDLYWVV